MAITTEAGYIAAKAGGVLSPIAKAAGTVATGFRASWWLATGTPTAGAAPTAAVVCTSALAGALRLPAVTGGNTRYLDESCLACTVANTTLHVADRVIHSGGLNGTLITAQAVNTPALPARAVAAACEWYLEWYVATGATTTTATVAVTHTDASTANIAVTVAASQAVRTLVMLTPAAGKVIASVQTVTLTASTATAGNFGVTALQRCGVAAVSAIAGISDRLAGVLRAAPADACLMLVSDIGTTASTTAQCSGYLALIEG